MADAAVAKAAVAELLPRAAQFAANPSRGGVLCAMCRCAKTHGVVQSKLLNALAKTASDAADTAAEDAAAVGALLGVRAGEAGAGMPRLNPNGVHAVAACLGFKPKLRARVAAAVAKLPPPSLVLLARTSLAGKHVLEPLLASDEAVHAALVAAFKGNLAAVALDPAGQHAVTKLFHFGSSLVRRKMAEELADAAVSLGNSPFGRNVARQLRIEMYARDRSEWKLWSRKAMAEGEGEREREEKPPKKKKRRRTEE